ncbi:RagB/SusD family nutrient uptake outer membrane protein [Confluentibacter sediminis]|uniref:RagB/SusD family nutrient uptake outer membrane protein n=1 Tax=Confluentibacter sediminis TaxID=2219045 RepID=UPI000DACCD7A|nr:RagB/SusD family nutrient uptake outer membrane protein [Confluentibacter sediminis]
MKKYSNKIVFLLLTCLILVSCNDDFLDIVPKGSQIAKTTEDYDLLLNNPTYYFHSTGGWQAPRWMGDEIAADAHDVYSSDIQAQLLFHWEDEIYPREDDTAWDLRNGLLRLYALNNIINQVMGSEEGTEAEKKALLAEAKSNRAFEYFQFINLYAKPYSEATASSDLGFPIVTTSDINENNFTRASVQEVYDFIIEDLTSSIEYLPKERSFNTRFTKPAAKGFLAKIYMFMARFDEALPLLNEAFDDLNTSTNPPSLYDYNVEYAAGGSFLPISPYDGPNGPGNDPNDFQESVLARVYYSGAYSGNGAGNEGIVLNPDAASLYESSDLRLNVYSDTYGDYSLDVNPNGFLRKYGIQYTRYGLELSELYLLRAECKARLNDLSGAVTDVEFLREKRMPVADAEVPASIVSDQVDLIKFILEERIREFATEGYRWFDMRRLSVDSNTELADTVKDTHNLYDYVDGETVVLETFTLKPERLTLRIPQSYIDQNPNMENNP